MESLSKPGTQLKTLPEYSSGDNPLHTISVEDPEQRLLIPHTSGDSGPVLPHEEKCICCGRVITVEEEPADGWWCRFFTCHQWEYEDARCLGAGNLIAGLGGSAFSIYQLATTGSSVFEKFVYAAATLKALYMTYDGFKDTFCVHPKLS